MNFKKSVLTALAFMLALVCASALDLPIKKVNGKIYYYYVVQKSDVIYSLPEKIGLPRKDILKYNPNAADGVSAGMVLTVPVEYDAQIKKGYYVIRHKVQSHETIYGVAKQYGISPDRIIDFNPSAAEGIRGLVLDIPVLKAEEQLAREESVPEVSPVPADTIVVSQPAPGVMVSIDVEIDDVPVAEEQVEESERYLVDSEDRLKEGIALVEQPEEEKTFSIALMLPFDLEKEQESKHSQLYTEFYRGFLMGVEKLSHEGGKVTLEAYDSTMPVDSLKTKITGKQNVIITSDNFRQLEDIAKIVNENAPSSTVFNLFAVKDTTNVTNPSVIQANIPRKQMYDAAIRSFITRYEGYTPVFIARIDGSADKSDFTSQLKDTLKNKGVEYKEIVFRNFLGKDNLENLNTADSAFVFVPITGLRSEFAKFAPALRNLRSTAMNPANVTIFGYPEWVAFRNDYQEQLHGLDACIYSRFYMSPEDASFVEFEKEYKEWYSCEMLSTIPMQAVMGYDAATFLVKYLRGEISEKWFEGIQTGFNIIQPEGMAGYINSHLYIINFRPDGSVTKEIVK